METKVRPHSRATGATRSRWAAIGAVIAITLGAGGLTIASATGSPPSSFVSITPERILDTRTDIGLAGQFTSPVSRTLQVTGSVPTATGTKTVVPSGATGVVLNVTAVLPTADGFISVRPDGTPGAPTTSNLNFSAGDIIPNAVIVALPSSGVVEITYDAFSVPGPTTDVLVDVTGYFVPGAGAGGDGNGNGAGGGSGNGAGGGSETLAGLSCAAGEIPKWSGSAWECAVDATEGAGYANVVTVAKSGGDHTSVATALDSISGSSSTNRYLVRVAPGVYEEADLVEVPPYVHLRGDGPNATVITSTRGANTLGTGAATIHVLENGAVSDLTVRNTGTGVYGIALLSAQTSRTTVIDNVVAEATGGGGTGHYAVYLNDAEPIIRNSTLRASGADAVNAALGVVNIAGDLPQPLIESSMLLGDPGPNPGKTCVGSTGTGFGIQAVDASPMIRGSLLCGGHRGVFAGNNGQVRIDSSEVHVSSTANAYMVETTGSAVARLGTSGVSYTANKFIGDGEMGCVNSWKVGTYTTASNGSTAGTACN